MLNEETPGKHARTILLCSLTLWADCKETYDKQGEALWIGLRELKSLIPWDQSLEMEAERVLTNRCTLEVKLNDKRQMKKEIPRSKRNSERRRMQRSEAQARRMSTASSSVDDQEKVSVWSRLAPRMEEGVFGLLPPPSSASVQGVRPPLAATLNT